MRYEDFIINQAIGVILPNDIVIDGKIFRKGHKLTQEDKLLLKKHEITGIYGAVAEDGDIDFKTAQNQISAQISGKGLGYTTQNDGICKILATCDGLFMADEQRINKFNQFNENIILNTIKPYTLVKKDDVVAVLDVVPPFISDAEVDDIIFRLSGNFNLLSVCDTNEKKTAFIYPHILNNNDENVYFTSVVMKLLTTFDNMELKHNTEVNTKYDIDSISDALFGAKNSDIIFVLSPVKCSSYNDVVMQAVKKYADRIITYRYPNVYASDFVIAQKGKTKLFVIPHSYDIVETTEIDNMIKYVIFSEYLDDNVFNNKIPSRIKNPNEFVNEKNAKIISPNIKNNSADKASVGIVVLAAGSGRRCGANKLLVEDNNGEPIFMKAVKTAIASDAKPVFVVTGCNHEEVEEHLKKYDVNIVYNRAYETGVQSSIDIGIKSVPTSCDGAILFPADMPNITSSDINRLIAKFDKTSEKAICTIIHKGVKNNPILWSKSLYHKAQIIPENANMRPVLIEHNDYIKTVEIRDSKKVLDINYPSQLKEYCGE